MSPMVQCFFHVVDANPQTKKVVRAAHLPRSESVIVIHMFSLLPNASPDEFSMALLDTHKWGRLDLSAVDLFSFLRSLQVWHEASPLEPRLTLPQAAKLAVGQLEAMQWAVPKTSRHRGIGYVQEPSAVWQASHELLAFLDSGGFYDTNGKYCQQECAPSWDVDIVAAMEACNVVHHRQNGFGECEVALVRDSLVWQAGMAVSSPCAALGLAPRSIEPASKFEFMVLLWREGWQCRDLVLEPERAEGGRVFSLSMSLRSRKYFVALASCEDLFAKGVSCIYHNRPDGCYKCLLQLGAEAVEALHNHPRFESLGNKDFVQALAGQPLLALADDAEGDFVADDDIADDAGVAEAAEAASIALVPIDTDMPAPCYGTGPRRCAGRS